MNQADDAPIEELKNLAEKSGSWLRDIGIRTIGDLRKTGPLKAYIALRKTNPKVNIVMLYALVAGLNGWHWADVPDELKQKLKEDVRKLEEK